MAACVKCGVKPPKDAEQLYEVEQQGSVVRGSRKMQHSNQLRCVSEAPVCPAVHLYLQDHLSACAASFLAEASGNSGFDPLEWFWHQCAATHLGPFRLWQ